MKKIFLLVFIVTVLPSMGSAQFGIKAGFNLSYVNGDNDVVTNRASRVGFQGGLMYKMLVKDDWLSIQPELIYIQKGGEFNIDQIKFDAKLDYVELPILGVFNVLGGLINFHAGPQFSWLTSLEYTGSEGSGPTNSFKDTELDNYNTFDIGLVIGGGVELEIVMIELRYSIGFLAVEKELEFNGQTYNPSSKNFNAQFIVSYLF